MSNETEFEERLLWSASILPAATYSDPYLSAQWHLGPYSLRGANVSAVWDEFRGRNVVVGILDDGIEYTHPDLAANYDTTLDYDARGTYPAPGSTPDNDAYTSDPTDKHGTTVAGVIGARLDNAMGGSGVAPEATIVGYRMGFGSNGTVGQIAALYDRVASLDVANNSWGYDDYLIDNKLHPAFAPIFHDIDSALAGGRDGLGTIVVFSAGNGRGASQDTNYHSFQNYHGIITVAATANTGNVASFSTPGASILVSAPGAGIWTTDRVGPDFGYNLGANDYSSMQGTSFSAPIVSGIVALMLEANPGLGWRDVQEILASTAMQTGAAGGWTFNDAGNWNGGAMHVSHDLGFGLVDAMAAVRVAESWRLVSTSANEEVASAFDPTDVAIPATGTLVRTLTLGGGLRVDQVEVDLSVTHPNISELSVLLTSPTGTQSLLFHNPPTAGSGGISFTFSTTHDWGESSNGIWTLSITDTGGSAAGTLTGWTIRAYGDATVDDVYVYTDEFDGLAAADSTRLALTDTGGTDAINTSAIATATVLDLRPGHVSTIDGQSVTLGAGTVIENADTGDGNDTITGNDAANWLRGWRGNDTLDAGLGADTLEGGRGNDVLRGGLGNDLYYFDAAFGQDQLVDQDFTPGNLDTIRFGEFMTTGLVAVSRVSLDLFLAAGADNITVANWFASAADQVELVEFLFDGTTWTAAQLRTFSNFAPVLANPVADQAAGIGQAFSFQVPASAFTDADVVIGDTLTYGATLASGGALPPWLAFNPVDRTFSGTPSGADAGTVSIKVTTTDSFGASVSDTFTLTVGAPNNSPLAADDAIAANENATTANLVATLLANDSDSDPGDTLRILGVNTAGTAGTVTFNAVTQTLTYTANAAAHEALAAGVTTTDSFSYTVADIANATDTATVSVTITGVNDAPTVSAALADQSATVGTAFSYTVPVSSFADVDTGDALTYAAARADGTALPSWIVFNPVSRSFSGTPGAGDAVPLTVRVTVNDGHGGSVFDDFVLNVVGGGTVINGTAGNDTLNGTTGPDVINGLGGNDTLNGLDGNDTLSGGAGEDTLNGGAGDDTFVITGSDLSFDMVNGGAGFDQIIGGAGDDTIRLWAYTGAGTVERIDGGAGVNVIAAREGVGTIIDLSGTQLVNIAQILGSTGNDTITGSAGNDVIVGGAGEDTMNGGAGDDVFIITGSDSPLDIVNGGAGFDQIVGGAGDDTIRLWDYTGSNTVERIDGGAGVNVVATRTAVGTTLDFSGTQLVNISQILGGTGNDTITGSAGNDVIVGGAGEDTMNGGAGDDTFIITGSDLSFDMVNGGAGFDQIVGGAGDDTIRLWDYTGASTVERIDGGAGVNVVATRTAVGTTLDFSGTQLVNISQILGGTGNDTITGSAGNDVIDGGAGSDAMAGGAGDDTYKVDSTGDAITEGASAGTDTVQSAISYTLGANLENLTLTGAAAINATGNALANTLTGNAAANTLDGAAGADALNGGAGNDLYLFNASFGSDTITDSDATAGNVDVVRFGAGITPASVAASRSGQNLVLTHSAGTVTVQNWYTSDPDKIERVEFTGSATVWDVATLLAMTGGSANNPPAIGGAVAGQTVNDSSTLNPFGTLTITDPDAGEADLVVTVTLDAAAKGAFTAASLTASGFSDLGGGAYSRGGLTPAAAQSAVRQLVFDPADNRVAPGATETTTFAVTVNDGEALAANSATTVVSTSINDAPAATNLTQTKAYIEGAASVALDDIVVTDVDPGAGITATLTLALPAAGALTTSGGATYSAATGVWTVTGTVAAVNAALAAVAFVPATNNAADTTIGTQIRDAAGTGPVNGSITLDVTPVNDAPGYTKGADQVVAEDAPAQTITGWATGITAGPPDESGQVLTFNVTGNTNPGLFAVAPTVAANGTLTYTLAANASGSAAITLALSDNGGTANGGVTTSAPQTFNITATAVNDAPVATNLTQTKSYFEDTASVALDDIVVTDVDTGDSITATLTLALPAAGALTTSGGATFSAATGVWTVTGTVAAVNAALAAVAFVPSTDNVADTTISTQIRDAAGTGPVNGSITLDVTPVNDAPGYTKGADQVVAEDAPAQTITGWATGITAGPSDESGQVLTFNVTGNTNPGLFAVAPTVAANGTLTYTLAANASGTAAITLALSDNGGTANGGVNTSAPQTFNISATAVNDAPVNTVPGAQVVNEDTNLAVTGVSVADVDAATLKVTLSASAGVLTLTTLTGLSFTTGDGTADAAMVFSGAKADVNAALTTLLYRGNANFNGADSITLLTSDEGQTGSGGTRSDTDAIAVTVNAVNDAPTVASPLPDQGATVGTAFSYTVSAGGFADVDVGDTLAYSAMRTDGTALPSWLTFNPATRVFSGTPGAGDVAAVTVRVTVNDGHGGSVFDDFVLNVVGGGTVINGTAGNDTLNGTTGPDVINGLGGNDTLNGLDGNDTLSGGAGEDTLNGGAGDDTFVITGSDLSFDMVNGGAGFDQIIGGAGDDTIRLWAYTGAGTVERIDGGAGVNVIAAREGVGTIIDLSGTQLVNIAQILGSTGNDTITGSAGNDVIVGGAGEDTMNGGAGDDVFIITGSDSPLDIVNGGAGFDQIVGGAGDDTIRLWDYTGSNTVERIDGGAGVNVVATRTAVGTTLDFSGTQLVNISQILGGTGNDTITGSAGNDVIVGGAGEDTMNGGAGDDVFIITGSDSPLDIVNGGGGFDQIVGGAGDDTIRLWDYTGSNTVERIDGGAGVNVVATRTAVGTTLDFSGTQLVNISQILGGTGNDTITGSAGNDVIDGGAGSDAMAGGAGNDTYKVDSTGDAVTEALGQGMDTVIASISYTLPANVEGLNLDGLSSINATGNTLANTLNGNSGTNVLDGRAGADMLYGGVGDDIFAFRAGEAQGDTVLDFSGSGLPGGDALQFTGFGAGATLTQSGSTDYWTINYGSSSETIRLVDVTTLGAGDYTIS